MEIFGTFKIRKQWTEIRADLKKYFIHYSYLHSKIQHLDYMQLSEQTKILLNIHDPDRECSVTS